eukprot:gb/GECG01006281.1/.p1 GENE.gb/GECG01006281.1/~~gb/GECG01006281.1/.p1  ORF type:complete len:463 (+),score=45.24 gb/GECG01006281.1/:1-1389(+)
MHMAPRSTARNTWKPNMSRSKLEVPKSRWTPEEDQMLLAMIKGTYGTLPSAKQISWVRFKNKIPGRTCLQLRERYMHALDPSIDYNRLSKNDVIPMLQYRQIYGNKWTKIARKFPGRTALAVKNAYYTIYRKFKRKFGRDPADDELLNFFQNDADSSKEFFWDGQSEEGSNPSGNASEASSILRPPGSHHQQVRNREQYASAESVKVVSAKESGKSPQSYVRHDPTLSGVLPQHTSCCQPYVDPRQPRRFLPRGQATESYPRPEMAYYVAQSSAPRLEQPMFGSQPSSCVGGAFQGLMYAAVDRAPCPDLPHSLFRSEHDRNIPPAPQGQAHFYPPSHITGIRDGNGAWHSHPGRPHPVGGTVHVGAARNAYPSSAAITGKKRRLDLQPEVMSEWAELAPIQGSSTENAGKIYSDSHFQPAIITGGDVVVEESRAYNTSLKYMGEATEAGETTELHASKRRK